jgi:hypothetical protein
VFALPHMQCVFEDGEALLGHQVGLTRGPKALLRCTADLLWGTRVGLDCSQMLHCADAPPPPPTHTSIQPSTICRHASKS